MAKKIFKSLLIFIAVLIAIIIGYFAYVLISYYRVEDNFQLEVNQFPEDNTNTSSVAANKEYRIASANLGFGAYSDDYSFFMDGGKESWAYSKDEVIKNINGSIDNIVNVNPDFYIFQEVDLDATRSYHVNQEEMIINILKDYAPGFYTFAQNYDSPFLMYPLTQPHGKSLAGIMTVSPVNINKAIRRQLPIEEGWSKLIDLDRCYSKSYIDVDNGKQLVIYNVHLSAYTTNPDTSNNQVLMMTQDMMEEFKAGNYVIAGGDMNKDLLGDSSVYFGTQEAPNWGQPFPFDIIDDSLTVVAPLDESNPVPTCRNADQPYNPDCFVITIDGFIVSSNVQIIDCEVINTEFKYSDHNPVYMDFKLLD